MRLYTLGADINVSFTRASWSHRHTKTVLPKAAYPSFPVAHLSSTKPSGILLSALSASEFYAVLGWWFRVFASPHFVIKITIVKYSTRLTDEWKTLWRTLLASLWQLSRYPGWEELWLSGRDLNFDWGFYSPLLTRLILVRGGREARRYSLSKEWIHLPRFARLIFLRKMVNFETNAPKLRCRLRSKIKITGYKKEKQDRCSVMVRQNYTYKFPATVSQPSKSWQPGAVFNIGAAGANCLERWWLRHVWTRLCDPGWCGGCQWSERFLPIRSYPMIRVIKIGRRPLCNERVTCRTGVRVNCRVTGILHVFHGQNY